VAVFPQKPDNDREWWEFEDLALAALDLASREFAVDPERVALTGMSQGGHGAWYLGARHASRWSCVAPVCGYGRGATIAPRLVRTPVWAFHGLEDGVVNPNETRAIVAALREERVHQGLPSDGPDAPRLTLYPRVGHGSWEQAYAEPGLAKWLLGHRRAPR
jgi:predicted peptidase